MILFVVRRRGMARGWAWGGGAILTLTMVALQVVLQTGRLGAGIVTMRAPIGFLSWEAKIETEKQKGNNRENSEQLTWLFDWLVIKIYLLEPGM